MPQKKVDTRELGLLAGLIFGKYFFKTEDLHYGYWPPDLELTIDNFTRAQEYHSDFIISHIPEQTRSILDVGCGVGTLAAKLIAREYQVDCVSPSPVLADKTRTKLGAQSTVYEATFEALQSDKRYDLILFSESFQYVKLPAALQQSLRYLQPGGHLLICDFFRTDQPERGPLGGGHRLKAFNETLSDLPYTEIKNIDITSQTAPNLDLIHDMLQSVGLPIWDMLVYYLNTNRPLISRFLKWKFKKKIEKINKRYFSGERNAENFKKYKTYRLLLFRKNN
ncbi:class I SAM-dependent DNA methyltransferase [candidate division CSSED10-310 bacterium]|uniref:Class I SAM-dependent DNA methyltransferase n=1 Tax=candidate division CSSED10-310 bacterium TaxID=2855610 RepID=A0ABV6YRA6_UNCC1